VKNKTVQEKCKVKSDDRFLIFALLFSVGRGPFLEVRALYYLPAKPLTATAVDQAESQTRSLRFLYLAQISPNQR